MILSTGFIALLIGAVAIGFAIPQSVHASTSPLGIVVPLYTYPTDGTWSAVAQAKQAYPNVPIVAVVNPDSGPGTSQDPNYVHGIQTLQTAGVKVLGYVDTAYGGDGASSVEANVNLYQSWYGVNGIFFDDMANAPGYEAYYSALSGYVHSLIPGSMTIGNPGTAVPTSYIGTLDALIIYESAGLPSTSLVTYAGYAPNYFATIAFGVPLSTSFLGSLVGVNSWVYLTDGNLPNPYDVLPSYFTSEVAAVSSIDGSLAASTTSTPGVPATLTVSSTGLSGSPVSGMWTTWNQNGAVLATGYTPTTFSGTTGQSYVVTAAGYGSTVFCYWQDGNATADRTLTLQGNTALTAYYSTSGSCPTGIAITTSSTSTPPPTTATTSSTASASSSTSSTSTATSSSATTTTTSKTSTTTATTTTTTTATTGPASIQVTVKSATTFGKYYGGMWTVVSQSGTALISGYTPLIFTAKAGDSYTVSVSNYGEYVFSHWSTGSTSSTITITPNHAITLTAFYWQISCPPIHKYC